MLFKKSWVFKKVCNKITYSRSTELPEIAYKCNSFIKIFFKIHDF